MKITINSRVLKSALENAGKGIGPKPTNPALANFLFKAEGGNLTITGMDEATAICETIPCEAEGEALIPASILDIARSLPDDIITIETAEATTTISWKNGQSTIPCYDARDFPESKSFDGEYRVIKGQLLAEAIDFTIPHTANDELRPIMNGVFFNAKDNGFMEIVASDAHTLARYRIAFDHKEPFNFVIATNALKFIASLAKSNDVEFACDERDIFFRTGTTTLITRKIEGKFPNYESIIPQKFASTLEADKSLFLSSIRRAMVCASKAVGHIKFTLGLMESVIEAQDLSLGTSSRETLQDASFDGADFAIGFKGDLLVKCLSACTDDRVKIDFIDASRAAVIKSEDETRLALVMPVQIQ